MTPDRMLVDIPGLQNPNGIVYHYTDESGLIAILESGGLRGTSHRHLNDESEIRYALNVAKDVVGSLSTTLFVNQSEVQEYAQALLVAIEEDLSSDTADEIIFVTCASSARDDLSQWRGYGNGGGYALGIDASAVFKIRGLPEDKEGGWNWSAIASWRKVVYRHQEQERLLEGLIRAAHERRPQPLVGQDGHQSGSSRGYAQALIQHRSLFARALAFIKHPSFEAEEEVRLVTAVTRTIAKHRSGKYGITPYVTLEPSDRATERKGSLPIESIVSGPGVAKADDAQGLKSLLAATHYSDILIERSLIPFR